MKHISVSAGGRGERMGTYAASASPNLPKHLLPIPVQGKTILGEISLRAQTTFEKIVVWASSSNHHQIEDALRSIPSVSVEIDTNMTGPLGPIVRDVQESGSRAFGCAGDFYCDFSWDDFESFHNSHDRPISILVARSVEAPGGARFHLEDSAIVRWERVSSTTFGDRINIGCYIIDPDPRVMAGLSSMSRHKEDEFFDLFVPMGLVAGYDPGVIGFNVNVPEVYQSLLHTLP